MSQTGDTGHIHISVLMLPKISSERLAHRLTTFFKHSHYNKLGIRFIFFTSAFILSLWILYHSIPSPLSIPAGTVRPEVWAERARKVKGAFVHAWTGYETLAAPHDELSSVSN